MEKRDDGFEQELMATKVSSVVASSNKGMVSPLDYARKVRDSWLCCFVFFIFLVCFEGEEDGDWDGRSYLG